MKLKNLLSSAVLATGLAGAAMADDGAPIGVNIPLLTSPFWQAYQAYLPQYAEELGLNMLEPVNSDYDSAKQMTDMANLLTLGAKAIVTTPIESGAVRPALQRAAQANVPVIGVDVAPQAGPIAIVVRADNRAYGTKACEYIGANVDAGPVVQIMGALASVNGRDRAEAFRECMNENYPDIEVLEIPAEWMADIAASSLDALLVSNPDISGIYMHAGGAFLTATLQTLERKGLLVPRGEEGHIVIVSNDGIPQEYEAIREGKIDATVSQPADLYAYYGLLYAKMALDGHVFEAGPTDHGSTIVEVAPGVLEDQLPAPLVTIENVDDPELWGNAIK
ncbi:sugar ABC transporter substrate-binding protein [Ruegeria sp. HKCCD7255]|uniref:sugar ABC transporter substrate-binding protein n=1 Tax=Ruegeria sp. HKCCD7255 TaxID=2683004 RepID=UPI001C2C2704|nr:sugar ABC transporter substrate-binding protein [Ruegeria sp. HKCCD7255]